MQEEWKEIEGYEEKYLISNFGNLMADCKEMKRHNHRGYERVSLYKDGKSEKFLVHVLVAKHFLNDTMFDGAEVNHIDCDKKNNHISNLEWVSGKENVQHYYRTNPDELKRIQKSMSKVGKEYHMIGVEASKKPVAQIDRTTGNIIAIFESAREASRRTGANYKNISQVCRGDRDHHLGYGWSFV